MQITGQHAVGSDALLIKSFLSLPHSEFGPSIFSILTETKILAYSSLPFPFLFISPTIPHALNLYTRLWCMKKKLAPLTSRVDHLLSSWLISLHLWWETRNLLYLVIFSLHQRHFLIIFEIKSHRVNVKENSQKGLFFSSLPSFLILPLSLFRLFYSRSFPNRSVSEQKGPFINVRIYCLWIPVTSSLNEAVTVSRNHKMSLLQRFYSLL